MSKTVCECCHCCKFHVYEQAEWQAIREATPAGWAVLSKCCNQPLMPFPDSQAEEILRGQGNDTEKVR